EEKAFEGLHVCAGGDHVHGHRDARIVVVPELRKDGFWVLSGLIGDLLAEVIALPEFLAHDLDDVVRVAVGLREYQGLRNFFAPREYLRKLVAQRTDDCSYLIWIYDGTVQLRGGVDFIFVLPIPPSFARQTFAFFDLLLRFDLRALLRDFRIDDVNLVA